jgi:flagellar hook-associated protein 2
VFTADTAGANGVDITANTTELSFTSQPGSLAQIKVDGIDIFRSTNTVSDAIAGVTFDLIKGNQAGETTSLKVDTDQGAVKQKITDFIKSYNDIVAFVNNQKDASWGRDSGLQSPKSRLQSFLTTEIGGSNALQTLSGLGFATQKDGTLKTDDTKLSAALKDNLAGVTTLLAGGGGVDGITAKFKSYLSGITSSVDGILTTRKKSTEAAVKRIDDSIERMEARLEKREKTLRAQFSALETLVGGMNSQSAFLTQQINSWNKD